MATTPSEADVAARLIERLLADPGFRARFRRDPAGACREAGLESLAQEMALGGGKAFHTLDIRESRSSLAGVMMAAAMEGIVIGQFAENVLPALGQLPSEVADVVSRVDLPAIKFPGGGNGEAVKASPPASDPPAASPGAGQDVPSSDVPGVAGVPAVPGVAPAAGATDVPTAPPPAANTPPAAAPPAAEPPAADAAKPPAEPKAPENDAAGDAAKQIADENSPEAAQRAKEEEAANALDEQTSGVPGSDQLPTGGASTAPGEPAPPTQSETIPGEGGTPAADPSVDPGDLPAPDNSVAPGGAAKGGLPASGDAGASGAGAGVAGAAAAGDGAGGGKPRQSDGLAGAAKRFARRLTGGGGEAKGGASAAPADPGLPAPPSAAASPVDNSLPAAPSAAENSLPATPADNSLPGDGLPPAPVAPPTPEALALLANKQLVLDATATADLQAGGVDPRVVGVLTTLSASHQITVSGGLAEGAIDITKVDGELVNPDSLAARELAAALAALDPSIRPDEVGTPWPISSPGFITNSAHQDQLRLLFKPPAAAPVDLPATPAAAAPVQPAVPVVPVQPTVPAVPTEPAYDPRKSDAFLPAVKASAASSRTPERSDSQAFLPAVEKPKPAVAAQPAQLAGQPVAAVAEAATTGPMAYPGDDAPKEQLAAWMAAEAEKRGLPPELPVMAALVESGLKNVNYGDADSLGFFQMRVSIWDSGPYKGFATDPAKQIDWFLDEAEKVKAARVAAGKPIDDPQHYGEWIADTERPAAQYRYRYQTKLEEAKGLLANRAAAQPVAAAAAVANPAAPVAAPAGGPLGPAALAIAQGELGVREVGTNAGPKVDEFLAAAGVPSGNPWCASFITWSLEKAGHKMPGGGWAAVQTWVRNAEQGKNGLQIVSAADARPGDIVAYDWGGQNDFGADGHIGFLSSTVKDGKFQALEGNNADAVSSVDRTTGSGNVVFIRVNGDATAGAAAPPVQAPSAAPPVDPKQFGGDEVGTGGPPSAETLAALNNPNLVFDDVGKADLKAGRIDPRVIGVLTKLSQEHKITVSCMCSDHSKFTAGGSVSNHFYGRGVDIAAIDGEIVGPGSPLAREIASEVSTLDPDIRPNEIGSPFAISGPGYFTDGAHQNHIHLGFKQEIPADWKPPADVAAQPAAVAPAQLAAVPGTPVAAAAAAPAEPAFDPRKSDAFLPAVKASAAAAGRDADRSGSQAFLPAVEKPKPAAAAVPAQAAAVQPAAPVAAQPGAAAPAVDVSAAVAAAPDAYPGDSAPKEQIAAWMAVEAEKRGLPPQLPIMAGLVESGLQNLNHGHADSVGFFQMRVGIWNQGAYAGYPDKPELQMKWFLDQAEAVKKQRLVAGKPIDDPNEYGEWIADVERPAEQYRGRYQLKLAEANQLLKAQPQPAAVAQPVAAPVDPAAAAAAVGTAQLPAEIATPLQQAIASGNGPGPKAMAAITEAAKHMGTPYKWGGSTPQTGFDCSGLMQWAYAQSGVQIPRVTYTQIEAPNGVEIADRSQLKPGDLVFFAANGDVHHVGMYLGGDQFLHAPSTGDVVKVSSLSEPYYAGQFAGGRRFDNAAPVAAPAAAQPAQLAAAPAQAAAIDPTEVAKAQAAVARDAAEVRRNDSQLFMAITRAEASKAAAEQERHASQMFLKAVDPSQVNRRRSLAAEPPPTPAVAPPVQPVAPAPATPAPPAEAPPSPAVAAASINPADAAGDYPGDNASQEQLAKWLAKQAEQAGLPPELPVMAALVESGVKNLNYGDADSVGFFQMRVGIWNKGAYAGYPEKPELQAKWFIDTALAVKQKAIARGDADFGKDPAKWGEWIADTERPAEQYRGRYQLRLDEARKLLT